MPDYATGMRVRSIGIEIMMYVLMALLLSGILFFTPRDQFWQLLVLFAGAFLLYFYLVWPLLFPAGKKSRMPNWLIAAIGLRLIAMWALPALSDDYFRFVWDGRLLAQGINPFLELPAVYMENPENAVGMGLTAYLFEGMNSPRYYTVYPPVLQAVFWLAAQLSPESVYGAVLAMKFFVLIAEVGTIWLMLRLLKMNNLSPQLAALYALNPFLIVELCGNLHFEAFMIFFLLLSVWLLMREKWLLASLPFALAIASKLLPIMLLPLLLRRLGLVRTAQFSFLILVLTGMLFLPLYSPEALSHLLASVRLYYESFEFNASFYYLIRWAGYEMTGYNIIQYAGRCLAIAKVVGILLIVWLEPRPTLQNLPRGMMWAFVLYFALASIVHPWYITTILALSIFTRYRFALIWMLVLPLSYFTYRTTAYEENLLLVTLAYLLVYGGMVWEWLRTYQQKKPM